MIIKEDFCLTPFNTFGIEVIAYELAIINSIKELQELFNAGFLNKKILILSKGSNILFTGNFEGLVLLNQIWGKEIVNEDNDFVYLKVNAGEFWPALVDFTVDNGWGGIENMTEIPGKVGAAPIQNIGAYGSELKDVLISLEAFDMIDGRVVEFKNSECEFGYRTSIFKTTFKDRFFITSILIKLSKNPKLNLSYKPLANAFIDTDHKTLTVKEVSNKVAEIRNSKLPNPDKLKNAGSFFKNPYVSEDQLITLRESYPDIPSFQVSHELFKIPAAWLIEKCNWKGKRVGNVGVHENQALVIVKYDKATGHDILNLANSIKKSVLTKFNIQLVLEVNVA